MNQVRAAAEPARFDVDIERCGPQRTTLVVFCLMNTRPSAATSTPHRYLTRARLRRAAVDLAAGDSRIVDLAHDCGYGDVSNFNHAFLAEFGTTPREHRARRRRRSH